jgi:copper chaperone
MRRHEQRPRGSRSARQDARGGEQDKGKAAAGFRFQGLVLCCPAMQTTLRIKGMSCGHCVQAVDTALRRVAGVKEVKVSVGEAVITTEGQPDETRLREVIQDEGFDLV